jgi:anti-sigma regulatory factor (Ser/Thr protein kinase)
MPPNPEVTRSHSSAVAPTSASDNAFRHELLLYEGADGFVAGTLAPVRAALERGAGVLVAVDTARATVLGKALGKGAERVRFLDVRALAGNPARLLAVWRDFASEHATSGEGCALAICEPVWPGRSPAELSECERHEALVNLAFGGEPAWRMLCTYDVDALEDREIDAARASHPLAASAGVDPPGNARTYIDQPPRPFAGSLPAPAATDPAATIELSFAGGELAAIRHAVATWAGEQGLERMAAEDLVLAVNELAANSIRHGGGAGVLCCWREPHALVCEVRDRGIVEEPLLGRRRPAVDATSGRGVWLVNQLCDLVQIRSGSDGTVVRVQKRLADDA